MRVKFSDVVKRVNIFVDINDTDRKYYIGKGGSIESDSFEAYPKALIEGATIGYKFHFGFNPGHILFMSRSFEQHKAATATFYGVCSDSTYVVETRDEKVLLQRYLQIEMQSERFWNWLLDHKTGGVNYLINYSTLAEYEFDLPPIKRQQEIADLLWSAYNLKVSYGKMIDAIDEMVKSQFIEQFSGENIPRYELSSLCSEFLDGDWIESKDQSDAGYRLVQTGNVGVGEYIDKSGRARFVSEETFKRLNCTEIFSGDILFSRLPEPLGRCCIIPEVFPKAITAVDCTIARLNEKCLPEFLVVYTATSMYSSQVDKCVTGTTRQRISRNNLAKISVPCPSRDEQIAFVKIVRQADKSKYLS